jgi:hypothetical protein
MTEERSVTFTAREITLALALWAKGDGFTLIPPTARLTLTEHTPSHPATATLTWSNGK